MTQQSYQIKSWGTEVEIVDVDMTLPTPEKVIRDTKEFHLVNTNGVCNDPLLKTTKYGGEFNTEPTNTYQEQIEIVMSIKEAYNIQAVGWHNDIHIHIHIPGLIHDTEALKRIARYNYTFARQLEQIFSIPEPLNESESQKFYYKRRKQSHLYSFTPKVYKDIMKAETPIDIFHAHVPKKNGKALTHLIPRCGVNLRSLWTNYETIEFRHFVTTFDHDLLTYAYRWVEEYITEALKERPSRTPSQIYTQGGFKFAKFQKINDNVWDITQNTNLEKHNRKYIQNYLKVLAHD